MDVVVVAWYDLTPESQLPRCDRILIPERTVSANRYIPLVGPTTLRSAQ
jgi:hypothetical protein